MTPKRKVNLKYRVSCIYKMLFKKYTSIVFKFVKYADAERYNEDLFRISFRNQDLF